MNVKLKTGELLDMDSLPCLTEWVRRHIVVTGAFLLDYDNGTGLCLDCNVTDVQDLSIYNSSVLDLAVYVDIEEEANEK